MEQAVDKEKKEKPTFTDRMRVWFRGVLDPIGGFLNRLGLKPNTMTLLGLIGNTLGAYFLAQGMMTIGGIIIFLMGPVDALDGTMARLRGEPSDFGAYVDSVTDRYSELIIFAGLLIFFLRELQILLTWRDGRLSFCVRGLTERKSYLLVAASQNPFFALGRSSPQGLRTARGQPNARSDRAAKKRRFGRRDHPKA